LPRRLSASSLVDVEDTWLWMSIVTAILLCRRIVLSYPFGRIAWCAKTGSEHRQPGVRDRGRAIVCGKPRIMFRRASTELGRQGRSSSAGSPGPPRHQRSVQEVRPPLPRQGPWPTLRYDPGV